jgi:hypothetical protein
MAIAPRGCHKKFTVLAIFIVKPAALEHAAGRGEAPVLPVGEGLVIPSGLW